MQFSDNRADARAVPVDKRASVGDMIALFDDDSPSVVIAIAKEVTSDGAVIGVQIVGSDRVQYIVECARRAVVDVDVAAALQKLQRRKMVDKSCFRDVKAARKFLLPFRTPAAPGAKP